MDIEEFEYWIKLWFEYDFKEEIITEKLIFEYVLKNINSLEASFYNNLQFKCKRISFVYSNNKLIGFCNYFIELNGINYTLSFETFIRKHKIENLWK